MDSARYVDARNTANDVVVPASYIGVLPARMIAIHRPRGVIGHDACVGKDGAGIAGLWYLEALGIPAATADGMTAEMGNGEDLYASGVVSHVNYPAEICGVQAGMTVREAADAAARQRRHRHRGRQQGPPRDRRGDPGAGAASSSPTRSSGPTRGREHAACSSPPGTPAAAARSFLLEAKPWGFICHDGGMSRTAPASPGWSTADEAGLAGACIDGTTAPIGDAFLGYADGPDQRAQRRGRPRVASPSGMTVKEAAHLLLGGRASDLASTAAVLGCARTRRELVRPVCRDCGRNFFTPQIACPQCLSEDWTYEPSSGRGRSTARRSCTGRRRPGVEVPFHLGIVDLDEGWSMLTTLVGGRLPAIDAPVEVTWVERGGHTIPAFRETA